MNIIKILENIFLSDSLVQNTNFLDENNIKKIIVIELDTEPIGYDEDFFNTYKIILSTNPFAINFDNTNDIILNSLSNSIENILFVSKDNLLGFIIIVGFVMKYLGVSLIDCLILGKNKNIVGLDKSIYIKHLSEYNLYLKNNK